VAEFDGPAGTLFVKLGAATLGNPLPALSAVARAGELKAAAQMAKTLVKGLGKLAAAPPGSDPMGTKHDALLAAAEATFSKQYLAAVDAALKKGGTAPLGAADESAAETSLVSGLQMQVDTLTAGEDANNPADRKLRGALIAALAAETSADFQAWAQDAKQPDSAKLDAALAKSSVKLTAAVGKAISAATTKGVTYGGPDATGISDAETDFVNTFVDLTLNGE